MKRSIIIFFVLFNLTSFSQKASDLGFLSSYFKELYKSYKATYNGKTYDFKEFDLLIDVLINNYLSRQIPNELRVSLSLPVSQTSSLKSVVDEINASREHGDFNPGIKSIVLSINSLRDFEKVYALSYLVDNLLYKESQIKSAYLDELLNNPISGDTTIYNLNPIQQASYLKTMGDFLNSVENKEQALELYLESAFMFDTLRSVNELGQVQESIANLYFSRDIDIYEYKGIEYLKKASESYNLAKNYSASINSQLKAASRMIWNNESFYFRDMIDLGEKLKGIINYKSIIEETSQFKVSLKNQYILHSTYLASKENFLQKPADYDFNINSVLGKYFGKHGDWTTAEAYFKTAIINVFFNKANSVGTVIGALNQLSWVYAVSKNESKCLYYWDQAFAIAKKVNLKSQISWLLFSKSHHLNLLGKSKEGLKFAKEGGVYGEEVNGRDYRRLYELKLRCFYELYGNLKVADSSNFYYEKLASLKSEYLKEFEHLNNLELSYTEYLNAHEYGLLSDSYDHLHNQFHKLDKRFVFLKKNEVTLNTEIKSLNSLSDSLKKQVEEQQDSMYTLDSCLTNKKEEVNIVNTELQKGKNELSKTVKKVIEFEKKLNNTKIFFWFTAGLLLLASAYAIYMKTKSREKDRKIITTREILSDMARSKLHDIKGAFNSFSLLLENKEWDKALSFASKNATAFTLSLEKWDLASNSYTIADEVALTEAIYAAYMEISDKNIKLKWDLSAEINTSKTLFMPESISTCVVNSLRHAFKKDKSEGQITVRGALQEGVVFFEIADDGTPSENDAYIRENKKNKGLHLLKRRLENVLLEKRISKKHTPFSIELNQGTQIKFYFPYEIPLKSNNS